MDFVSKYLNDCKQIIEKIDQKQISSLVELIASSRDGGGRVFVLGVGGSAANASHAVNDFRKICGIEAYAPTDNVAELTARINDDGWANAYSDWLKVSRLNDKDLLLILSVGGGDAQKSISVNLIEAIKSAKQAGAKVCGICGRDGGFTANTADICVLIPVVNSEAITAYTEAFQSVIWHLLVTHPQLQKNELKWEGQS